MCIFKTLWEIQSFMFCQTKHDSLWCSSFLLGIWNSNSQLAWRTLFGISYTLSLLRHISTIFLYLKNSLLAFTLDRFMAWIKNSRFIAVASHPLLLPPPLLYFSPVLCPLWSEVKSLRHVRLFVIPWTLCDPLDCIAHQAPLSLGFSRQEYWSGLPFPSPGDLPDPGIEPRSPTLQANALSSEPPGKPYFTLYKVKTLPIVLTYHWGLTGGAGSKEPNCQCRRFKRCLFNPWVGNIP